MNQSINPILFVNTTIYTVCTHKLINMNQHQPYHPLRLHLIICEWIIWTSFVNQIRTQLSDSLHWTLLLYYQLECLFIPAIALLYGFKITGNSARVIRTMFVILLWFVCILNKTFKSQCPFIVILQKGATSTVFRVPPVVRKKVIQV